VLNDAWTYPFVRMRSTYFAIKAQNDWRDDERFQVAMHHNYQTYLLVYFLISLHKCINVGAKSLYMFFCLFASTDTTTVPSTNSGKFDVCFISENNVAVR